MFSVAIGPVYFSFQTCLFRFGWEECGRMHVRCECCLAWLISCDWYVEHFLVRRACLGVRYLKIPAECTHPDIIRQSEIVPSISVRFRSSPFSAVVTHLTIPSQSVTLLAFPTKVKFWPSEFIANVSFYLIDRIFSKSHSRPPLRNIPTKYNIIVRLWTYGFHKLLESLRAASFGSPLALEHLQDFIYYAYSYQIPARRIEPRVQFIRVKYTYFCYIRYKKADWNMWQ